MLVSKQNGRFFLPGPTEVEQSVLEAQTLPMMGHRGKPMEELMERIGTNLKTVFRTQRPVYIATSSATGMMEAAIRNCVSKKVLCLVNGAFSERFYKIAQACGANAVPLNVDWGEYHSPNQLRDALRKDDYDAVTMAHSETSTGVLNPVEVLTRVVHEHESCLALIDSVSGVAGAPVECDAWKLDFLLTGSQKALAVPPGLAFGVAQEVAVAKAKTIPGRGIYFDFIEMEKGIHKHQTPNTPAVSLLHSLDVQLQRIVAETMATRWARHREMAERTYAWVTQMQSRGAGIGVLAPVGYRSQTVTCVTCAQGGVTGSQVAAEMTRLGFTVSAGYGKLRDATFRIGHMGDHTLAELNALLDALAGVLVR
jgi:predicted phosphoserine aminotransferase